MTYHESQSQTTIIKFKGQDFQFLRDRCLRRGQLFEDDTFPPTTASIGTSVLQGKSLSNLEWKRPKDLSQGDPHFILEGVSRFDIQQGVAAGDCWFLAALGSLTQSPQHLQKILMDQSFSYKYAGIFRFRFWQCGQWIEVVVDDRLPIRDREYLFVHPRRDNLEFWPSLLEKAYAKLRGSYHHLHFGYLPDALVDLTGGVVTSIDLHSTPPADLVRMVKTAAREGSLVTCATPAGPSGEEMRLENGLVSQHAYTVTGAEQIQYRRSWENLIRLWNPWGNTEWQGRWRDGSLEWQETQDPLKHHLHDNKEDGEFWMACEDFQENFSCLYICHHVPVSMDNGNLVHERWSQMMFKNHLIPWNPAGARCHKSITAPSSAADMRQEDPQYLFSVPHSTQGINAVVSFTIMPHNLNLQDQDFAMGFQVYRDPQFQQYRERLPPTFFSQFRNEVKGVVSRTKCNLTKCFTLSPGPYVVKTSAHRDPVQFLARIFVKMPGSNRKPDSNFNLRAMKATLPESNPQQNIFYKHTQQGKDLDARQLQSLLNQELVIGPREDSFSLDECRSIVALMDVKVNGLLDPEEFARLWDRVLHCQEVFQNIQKHSGVFLTSDLWKAIRETDFLTGVSVTSQLLDLMKLRYSDSSRRISFPSLACFLMRLEAMAKTFRNLSKDGKGLYLTEVEWLNLVMYN
ncbi:calpain-13 [Erinaceus europaeus]|uniref:Calpain-13 n=1 Tax=Erinaceus europaeus TaxID=9365 RepID=A0ABM3X1X0_ERIEU|nr:calpain-13 [Erinaceus europaeus]